LKLLLIKEAPMKKVTKPTKTHNLQDAAAKKTVFKTQSQTQNLQDAIAKKRFSKFNRKLKR